MNFNAADVDAKPCYLDVRSGPKNLGTDSTCICDPSIVMSLPSSSTVDRATCTSELYGIPFIHGETAIVQTEIALYTRAQCQIYMPILNRYAKSLKREGPMIDPTIINYDCPNPQLDLVKMQHDLDTLRTQNEKLIEQILNCRREIEEQGEAIHHLSKEKVLLATEKEDIQAKLAQLSREKDEALTAMKQAQKARYERPEFVLRDECGSILFDERLLPSNSEAIIHIVKADGVITYHIYAEINEFLSQQRQRSNVRNVKLQIGAPFLHMNTCQ